MRLGLTMPHSTPLVPAPQPGEDPFAAMQKAKKERVKKNRAQQLENAQNVLKEGGSLPTTLRLAAQLGPRDSQGEKGRKRKHLKDEVRRGVGKCGEV